MTRRRSARGEFPAVRQGLVVFLAYPLSPGGFPCAQCVECTSVQFTRAAECDGQRSRPDLHPVPFA
jgi:hypothetical protein